MLKIKKTRKFKMNSKSCHVKKFSIFCFRKFIKVFCEIFLNIDNAFLSFFCKFITVNTFQFTLVNGTVFKASY